jgi:serine/threonine-protein kinase
LNAAARLPAVPGYELEELIGSGSMGCVYRAVQLATGASVAVKVISPAHAHDQEATRMFIREATLLSGLNHPGIVKLFEIGLAEGRPFLAMEYMDAVPHAEILGKAGGAGRTRIACAIICHVLDALGHAHMRSLVHRDVKPANILLARSGRKLQVKLADFGLARNYMVVGLSSITHDGDLRGTIAFMPPEQILDCRYARPTCDLYAAGVTLYQYLSGRLPFEFGGERSHFATVLNEEPIPLERFCPDLPAELAAAVNRAIAKDRGERFVTAHEMREAIVPFSRRQRPG